MTLRLPLDLREAITDESRVKGDLAKIVLFALSHVDQDEVDIQQTRKAGMDLTNPQLLHECAEARTKLNDWAEAESVSVNAIVVSPLDEFFARLKKARRCVRNCGWSFVRIVEFCITTIGPNAKRVHLLPVSINSGIKATNV